MLRFISLCAVVFCACLSAHGAALPAYHLSPVAAAAARLTDSKSFEAAHQFFLRELGKRPHDAGLYSQYVRFLILSRDPAYPDFVQSPLFADGGYYWAEGVAEKATTIACQYDPKCKTYLASLILKSFADCLRSTFKEGRGCIGGAKTLYMPETDRMQDFSGIELSMINICWRAIYLDPNRSSTWVTYYQPLLNTSIHIGKAASAMMLGNLVGDLRQHGKGAEDFKVATRSFVAALNNYKPDGQYDWLTEAANSYPLCFRDEMLAVKAGKLSDPSFNVLKRNLARFGVTIPNADARTQRQMQFPTGASPVSPR